MSVNFCFSLNDQLPLVSHVVSSIMELSPGGLPWEKKQTQLRKSVITAYMNNLYIIWCKAFGADHVQCKKTILKKIHKALETYYREIIACNRKDNKSKRVRRVEWRKASQNLFDIKKQSSDPNTFRTPERKFYYDQLDVNSRKMFLSEEIDCESMDEYSEEGEVGFLYEDRSDDSSDDNGELNNSHCSLNRSGKARANNTSDSSTQTDLDYNSQPNVRLIRNCTEQIKSTCVQVSVKCGVSVQVAKVAVQTVCKELYNHQYYCTKEEAIENDPSLHMYQNTEDTPRKKSRLSKDPGVVPITRDQYTPYKNVLPSVRVLTEHKQRMAIQDEAEAANALYNKPENVKCTLHYDTTSRAKIDGEWPAIILNFAGRQRFSLRPLFFAYEDRLQIVDILVETFKRLSVLASEAAGQMVSTKSLWEKITAFMTDSAEKNLKVEKEIASALHSEHIPLRLLCKAHTVEALDRSNIRVLANIEEKIKFREALISVAPSITPFLRGERSVSVAAIKSIVNFISHDKSSSSSNQAALFDFVLERENKVKHINLYKERRFTQLGYSCASILDALPYIRMVVNETHLHNQHVEIMRIILDSEFLLSELSVLAYFTHKVTLPLLNAVETATQDELCSIFPQLFQDLNNGSLETLAEFNVAYHHVIVKKPTSEVEVHLLKEMCHDAAKVIELQCGREYGFGATTDMAQRATKIFQLSQTQKHNLETTNIIAEREFAIFDHRASVAKTRNYKFKAKSLRNDMILHKSKFEQVVQKLSLDTIKQLNKREEVWTEKQWKLHCKKIEEKLKQAKNSSQYTMKLLQRCKSWGGPVISTDELGDILKNKPGIAEHIVRTELAYYRDTHKADVILNPKLFRLNKISHNERYLNSCALLSSSSNLHKSIPLPKNEDVLAVIQSIDPHTHSEDKSLHVNEICVTLWVMPSGEKKWYLGYWQEVLNNKQYVVEHLERVNTISNLKWRYPSKEDIATVDEDQILDLTVTGQWNVEADRNMTYTLKNHLSINDLFEQFSL